MRVVQVTQYPEDAPISVEEARAYCRQDTDAHDGRIRDALNSACVFVSKRTNKALAPATFHAYLERWERCPIRIPWEPVSVVNSIVYRDQDGNEQTVAPADWQAAYEGGRATITFPQSFTIPSLYLFTARPIVIEFEAGFAFPSEGTGTGSDPNFILDPRLKQAALMLTAHWFENAGVARIGQSVTSIEATAEMLLQQLGPLGT